MIKTVGAEKGIIVIEDNKEDAIEIMEAKVATSRTAHTMLIIIGSVFFIFIPPGFSCCQIYQYSTGKHSIFDYIVTMPFCQLKSA